MSGGHRPLGGSCIASQVLPGHVFRFVDRIDLMDETLREGAERATVPPTLEDKCDLAEAITACGVRSIVVGMFPDVPHNIAFLQELVRRQQAGRIPADTRFLVISHVGVTMRQTLDVLERSGIPTQSVWIILIHSVSDLQIRHLFPVILKKDPGVEWDGDGWSHASDEHRRRVNLEWFDRFLGSLPAYSGGGIMIGLLDAFRADHGHLVNAVAAVERNGFKQVRLVDTAGTCLPQQVDRTVGDVVARFPQLRFYGHFHDDFGMATSNAIVGLSLGLQGVDVSVGGFANRAGHPALGKVAMALRKLYGVELPNFRYDRLYELSRLGERLYGLMENPAQAVSGVVTHAIQSGIRTELLKAAPTIFDIIDPAEVGSDLVRMFGVRSGRDGLLRFLKETRLMESMGIEPTPGLADQLYPELESEWKRRSASSQQRLRASIQSYHEALKQSFFTEADVLSWLKSNLNSLHKEWV